MSKPKYIYNIVGGIPPPKSPDLLFKRVESSGSKGSTRIEGFAHLFMGF